MKKLHFENKGFSFSENKGFTLIELLVVIAIIGVLASMVLVSMNGSRGKARDARRLSDFREIGAAEEVVMNDSASYQTASSTIYYIPAIKNAINYQYLTPMSDPGIDSNYKYVYLQNNLACGDRPAGTYYCAITKLEDASSCGLGEFRYFVVHNTGTKEICSATDYVVAPPTCATCLSW